MAQSHAINGTTINYIGQPNWEDMQVGVFLSGETIKSRWRNHTWSANVMPVDEFNTMYSLLGQKISLLTTNYTDRNGDYITYYDVDFISMSGTHDGPRFLGVSCEFKIRV